MKIAFQGEIGAYSEEAVLALFPAAEVVPLMSFDEVFAAVEAGQVEYGVIPIENSLFGSVHVNYDLLREHSLVIVGEWYLRIQHQLMAGAAATIDRIRRVYSHPQALGQCRNYLKEHLSHVEVVPAYDTAGAAKMVAESGKPEEAAIASRRAALEYNLSILAQDIESNHQNYTRFLALTRPDFVPTGEVLENQAGPFKTSIVYAMKENVPGALFKSLAVFALRDLDLFKIESRPLIGSPGSYVFYLDLEGTIEEEGVVRALGHLEEIAADVKVLGSYVRGRIG